MRFKSLGAAVLAVGLTLPPTTGAEGLLTVELRHIATMLLVQAADEALAALDANRDGCIDRDEAGEVPDVLAGFDRIDRDGDGRISPAEWVARDRQAG
ncbi:MAG TPA: hypothetical protein PL143_16620 [Rhodocyclaceae bacterium]|nr:hypothetical protein [Rhodocyclaceae bacterium]